MEKIIRIIEGKIQRDIYGSFDDCSPGLYIDTYKIESIFTDYTDKKIKVTIEEVEEE